MEGLSRGQAVYMGRLGSEAISILGLLWNLHGDVHINEQRLSLEAMSLPLDWLLKAQKVFSPHKFDFSSEIK